MRRTGQNNAQAANEDGEGHCGEHSRNIAEGKWMEGFWTDLPLR